MPTERGWHLSLSPEFPRRCFHCGFPIRPLAEEPGVPWSEFVAVNGNGRCPMVPPSPPTGQYGQHEPAHDMPDPADVAAMEQWLNKQE